MAEGRCGGEEVDVTTERRKRSEHDVVDIVTDWNW